MLTLKIPAQQIVMGAPGRSGFIAATSCILLLQVSAHAAGQSLHVRRTEAEHRPSRRSYEPMPSQPWNAGKVAQDEPAYSIVNSQACGASSPCPWASLIQPSKPSDHWKPSSNSIAEQVVEKKGFELYLDRKSLEIPNAKSYTRERALDDCIRYVRAMPKALVNCYYNGVKLR